MTARKAKVVAVEAVAESIVAYKGFNPNWTCNPNGKPFQYEIGKTFTHDGDVVRCQEGGFHACENPLDVFGYYAPGSSRFAVVKMTGKIARDTSDSKIASGEITIEAEIAIPALVTKAIKWITALCKPADVHHATGYSSASSATGDRSASSATGYRSASSATGYSSASSATGYRSASSATGDSSASSATGDRSASSVSGNAAVALNTGRYGRAKAGEGGAIVLCLHDDDGNLLHIKAARVGVDEGIKVDVWYSLDETGAFVEVA